MKNKKIMLGNEAIARGAYEAGVKVSSAYPGTPSTEISEFIAKYDEIYAEWASNEKVALEMTIGASIVGVRSIVSMKHVGLNVASDPLYTLVYEGVNAGLVLVVADDPGLYSSQNEQDTRCIAKAAQIPVLEPSDSQEAKDFIKFAFDISEKYDTPVILRTTTKLSHSSSIVTLEDRINREDTEYIKDVNKYVMIPSTAKKRHVCVEKRMKKLIEDGSDFSINKVEYKDKSIGFITSGIAYQYVKEACPNASILKLGIVNPLPKKLIVEFCEKVESVYVFEELEPVIEEQVKSWGINVKGKEIFTLQGEYSANMIRKVVFGKKIEKNEFINLPIRLPALCSGCPHRSVYSILKKLNLHVAGDIGCYTLGALEPMNVVDTSLCMGASISTLHGIEKAKGKEYIKNWVAAIGDSTFLHTGINGLINMVYNKSNGTVLILDNSTTAMTGHQDHPATGKTLKGEETQIISIYNLCKAIGVRSVYEINAFDLPKLENTIKKAVSSEEVSVIIVKSSCVLLKGNNFKFKCKINKEKCKKCYTCFKLGCPALVKNEDKTISIDENSCNGCTLCMQNCKFDAIEKY